MVDLIALLAGGGTGLIGSLVGRVAGHFERKQKLKEKELEYNHELKLFDLNSRERSADREHEADMVESREATEALGISFQHDTSYGDSLLRWVRPALTVLLIILVFVIYLTTTEESQKSEIITQVLFLSSLAVGWWFADRSGKK